MQAYVDVIRKLVERLKAAAADADLVLDANASLTPGDASFIATALERNHLLWLDEPTEIVTSDAVMPSDSHQRAAEFHELAAHAHLSRSGAAW